MKKTGQRKAAAQPTVLEYSSFSYIKRLWREHIYRYKGLLALVILLTLITAGATSLYPLAIDYAFRLFSEHSPKLIYEIPVLVLMITFIKGSSQYGQNVLLQKLSLQIIRDIQNRLFKHTVYADLALLQRESPAQTATHFTTDAFLIRDTLSKLISGVSDTLTVAGLIASMFVISWQLSLLAIVLYPISVLPIQRIGRKMRRISAGIQDSVGNASEVLNESFMQARTVKAFGLEETEIKRAAGVFDKIYKGYLKATCTGALVDPMLEVIGGFSIAIVIAFVGWQSSSGAGAVGSFTGFVSALLIASRPMRSLGVLNTVLQTGISGAARVFGLIDEPYRIKDLPDAKELPTGRHGHIVFEDVGFAYATEGPVLSQLSFEAEAGKTLALVGASGAGKTTIVSLIPRFYDVTSGKIMIDGADIREVTKKSLRQAMAYVSQEVALFDDTIRANIAMGKENATEAEIKAAARAAAIDEFIETLPAGYETPVGTFGQRLSGGQRQRISLARALLRNPRILLLDEATGALDAASEEKVQKALELLRKDRTTVIVAHRLATVQHADRIIALSEGKIVEQGNYSELMQKNGYFASLVRSQALSQA